METVKTPKGTVLPLINLKGKAYLQVAYRLVWFREEHPDWAIETCFTSLSDTGAIAMATILDQSGRSVATAHKSETKLGFADFLEKAETGAIGRALALCGYGTQFTDDLEEGERIVDGPLAPTNGPRIDSGAGPSPNPHQPQQSRPGGSGAFCSVCGTELLLSKSGAGYYCPNFKDGSKGEHTRIKAADLAAYKSSRAMAQESDIPF